LKNKKSKIKKSMGMTGNLSVKSLEIISLNTDICSATFSPPQIVNLILHALKEKQLIN